MTYKIDRVAQLENALTRSRFGQVASLRSAGVPARQHNMNLTKKRAAKKTAKKAAAKKTVSAKPVKKTTTAATKKTVATKK